MRTSTKNGQFTERHISFTWDELHDRFGFNVTAWRKKFDDYLMKQPRETDAVSAFFRFGNDRINPLLNEVLGRSSGFPTFERFTEYISSKH